MPTVCCAIGCKHATGNGVCHLKRFPTDEKRALIWAENVRGSKWQRKGWELLCDCHFDTTQFEKPREDGAKKLKHNAIPTLFPTHTLPLVDSTTSPLITSVALECHYEPYDFEPLCEDGIHKLPDPVPFMLAGEVISLNEVHFEDSAFESHRADGLRKLKPNAIPTIHTFTPSTRSKRKQIVQTRIEFPRGKGDDDDGLHGVENAKLPEDESVPSPGIDRSLSVGNLESTATTKKLKTVHVTRIVSRPPPEKNDGGCEFFSASGTGLDGCRQVVGATTKGDTSEVLPVVKGKRGRPRRIKELARNVNEEATSDGCGCVEDKELQDEVPSHTVGASEVMEEPAVRCFVCSQVIASGCAVYLSLPTEATNVLLQKRLEWIAELEGKIDSHEVVCSRCSSLLNYIDRTEAELMILKGAISTCMKSKRTGRVLEGDSELQRSMQMLDRFLAGLDEKNYLLNLEEIFLSKAEKEESLCESSLGQQDADCGGGHDSIPEDFENHPKGRVLRIENLRAKALDSQQAQELISSAGVNEAVVEPVARMGSSYIESHCFKIESVISENEVQPTASVDPANDTELSGDTSVDDMVENPLGIKRKTLSCKICCFKTIYESVMTWHLRMHMKTHRWCDFCTAVIPKEESLFTRLKKITPTQKSSFRKISSKPLFVLPAVPVNPVAHSPYPLSSLKMPVLPLDTVSPETQVVVVDTKELKNDLANESCVENSKNMSVGTRAIQGDEVVISGNDLVPETTEIAGESIFKQEPVSPLSENGEEKNYLNGATISLVSQGSKTLETYCKIQEPPAAQVANSDNPSSVHTEFGERLHSCRNLSGSNAVEGYANISEPCSITSKECVHNEDSFVEDSVETSFLNTLTSQPVAKNTEILLEICDDATDQSTMSVTNSAPERRITNKDISFARSDGLGESELAMAYESSVAALMCQSDDSDGILYQ